MSDDEVEEHPEGPQGTEAPEEPDAPPRNPFVVVALFVVLAAVVAVAWWSSREQVVTVPDVVGVHVDAETLEPVRTTLESRDLLIDEVSTAGCPELTPANMVVSQTPAAGIDVPFGTGIDLAICRR